MLATQKGRNPALDGVRGLAILLVVVSHAGVPVIRYGASVGLTLFFVLSGHLITAILLKESRTLGSISLGAFYTRRALRLLPALFVVVGAVLVINVFVRVHPFSEVIPAALMSLFYVANLHPLFDVEMGYFGHYWSLALEEQFYLFWPMALIGYFRLRRPYAHAGTKGQLTHRDADVLVIALVAISVVSIVLRFTGDVTTHAGYHNAYYLPHTNVFALLLGCASAVWISRRSIPHAAGLAVGSLAVLFVLATVVGMRSGLHETDDATTLVLRLAIAPAAVIPAILLVCGAVLEPDRLGFLQLRPIKFFGLISYGLYLWHGPCMAILVHLAGFDDGSSPKVIAVKLVAIVVAIALATASYRFVELPFIRRKAKAERVHLSAHGEPQHAGDPAGDAAQRPL